MINYQQAPTRLRRSRYLRRRAQERDRENRLTAYYELEQQRLFNQMSSREPNQTVPARPWWRRG